MKFSLPKIIALMAALIAMTLVLGSRGCGLTEVATNKKPDVQTQPGGSSGSSSTVADQQSGEKSVATISEWDSHNLVFLGENFIPVGDAYSTPFATFYRIDEKGYIPTQPIGPINTDGPCQKKWYAKDRAAGVGVITERNDTALDTATEANSSTRPKAVLRHCPRALGSNWEAGSYVFDKDGTDLAGLEFKTNPYFYEVTDQLGRKYIAVTEGGKGPKNDPAMRKMKLATLLVDDTPYPDDHDHGEAMKDIQNRIPGGQGADVKIEYLPAKSDYENQDDLDDATFAAVQRELDALIERRSKDMRPNNPDYPGAIAIHLRMQSYSADDLAGQKKRIDAKLKKILDETQAKIDATLTAISLGSELTTCQRVDAACRAINNSIALYSDTR